VTSSGNARHGSVAVRPRRRHLAGWLPACFDRGEQAHRRTRRPRVTRPAPRGSTSIGARVHRSAARRRAIRPSRDWRGKRSGASRQSSSDGRQMHAVRRGAVGRALSRASERRTSRALRRQLRRVREIAPAASRGRIACLHRRGRDEQDFPRGGCRRGSHIVW
jgi:hypothetical protein